MTENNFGAEQHNFPEIRRSQIEDITEDILQNEGLLENLGDSFEQKIDLKQRISDDDGTNDFSEWKRLGIFIIHQKQLPDQLLDVFQENGIAIGREVLELHIPPQVVSAEDFKYSLTRLKEYLKFNKSNGKLPKYIYGVSYLATYAKRWGFTVIDLPQAIQGETGAAKLLRDYAEAIEDPKKQKLAHKFQIEDIKLCYTSVDTFLSRN